MNCTVSGSSSLRVALMSDLLLLQRIGGVQRKLLETAAGLQRLGHQAAFFNPTAERLKDFDVAHVFDIGGGNERLVKGAQAQGLPTIVSPVIHPVSRSSVWRARLTDFVAAKVCGDVTQTSYRQMKHGLHSADRLIALTQREKATLVTAFDVDPAKVDIVPNGISPAFFAADPTLFLDTHPIKQPFVLCVGQINLRKNQIAIARAIARDGIPIVLIGACNRSEAPYLEQILGYENVTYLGPLHYNDPLLPSAYAAAGVFVLPSTSEVTPNGVFEALAAGTPVVVTRHHSMMLDVSGADLREIDPYDDADIRNQTLHFIENPGSREHRRSVVADMSWDAVAAQIAAVYSKVLRMRADAPAIELVTAPRAATAPRARSAGSR